MAYFMAIFLNYASIILCYLDTTEFLVYLLKNYCSKFAKFCIACSVLRLYIKRVRGCLFVFCLQIHALAGSTMNSKFSILHSATPRAVLKISRSLCGQRVRVFVNKTLTTVSNP